MSVLSTTKAVAPHARHLHRHQKEREDDNKAHARGAIDCHCGDFEDRLEDVLLSTHICSLLPSQHSLRSQMPAESVRR